MVLGVAVLYGAFSLLMAVFGQRLRVRVSVFSVAFFTLIGSVAARAMLGRDPTVSAGLIVLAELLLLQGAFHRLRRHLARIGWRQPAARAVMVHGVVNADMLAAAGLREADLWVQLRRAGIGGRDEVAYAIVEPDGSLTVLRSGRDIDPDILTGVAGL